MWHRKVSKDLPTIAKYERAVVLHVTTSEYCVFIIEKKVKNRWQNRDIETEGRKYTVIESYGVPFQGFTATSKNVNRTLGDLKKAEEVKHMDPVAEKIYNWTGGKERNIRALLSSLNDVLWEGAENWQQPRMGDLLSASQVKRSYYKACLVVHPDKQVGEPHEMLARAIFTELNDAWNAFEQEGSKSL
ncbi:DnaJ domain protein [Cooperia oncophora]